jgi:hypothetical protein
VKAVYGLYPNGASAQQAVNRLRAAGLADREITIASAQPMEDFEFGHIDRDTWMWWFALNVGGLPIWAWWPNIIIIFELTMLGAITATIITLIASALLPQKGQTLYDPEVTDGQILVGVENPVDSRVVDFQKALEAPPGARIKTL